MALFPDIVITTNRGASSNPTIQFTGLSSTNNLTPVASSIHLEVFQDGTVAFVGSNGTLFSITDSVSGSLMAVSDQSGLPVIEVFSDDKVVMGTYSLNTMVVSGSNVSIGTLSNTNAKFTVLGTTLLSGGAQVTGDTVIWSTTASTSTSTGALIVSGGIAAGGNGYFGGTLNAIGNTLNFGGGSTIIDNASGQQTYTAGGTNQSIILMPSGTGKIMANSTNATGANISSTFVAAGSGWSQANATQSNWQLTVLNNSTAYNANPTAGLAFVTQRGVGTWDQVGAGIWSAKANTTSGDNQSTLNFGTADSSTVLLQAMQINQYGTLQIGMSSRAAPAWSSSGIVLRSSTATYTDNSTALSGSAAIAAFHSFGAYTLAATNGSVTTSHAATVYIAGGPIAGTNQTIANSWGLWNVGKHRQDDYFQSNAGTTAMAFAFVPGQYNIYLGAEGSNQSRLVFTDASSARIGHIGSRLDTQTAWGTTGVFFNIAGRGQTDTTSASGTTATAVFNSFQAPTLASTNTVTYTDAATVYIGGSPNAGTNATLTNPWGLWNVGASRFDNFVKIMGGNALRLSNPANNAYASLVMTSSNVVQENYPFSITDTTASTSSVTGSLTLSGGLGVQGAIYLSGKVVDSQGTNVRAITQNAQTTGYTLVATDAGKHISITTGGVTVPNSIFSVGDAISIFNNSNASQTITQGTGVTMYLSGVGTTGNRTLAQYGLCTVLCVAAGTFVISGAGLT